MSEYELRLSSKRRFVVIVKPLHCGARSHSQGENAPNKDIHAACNKSQKS